MYPFLRYGVFITIGLDACGGDLFVYIIERLYVGERDDFKFALFEKEVIMLFCLL
jgi:hypothetical protein